MLALTDLHTEDTTLCVKLESHGVRASGVVDQVIGRRKIVTK